MANSKPATRKPRKRTSGGSSNGSAPKARKSNSGRSSAGSAQKSKSTASARGNGNKSQSRSGGSATKSKSKSRATGANATKRAANPTATDRMGQVVDTAKQAAGKAKGPALTVGAAAAGVAGGLALKSRLTRPKVLGVPLPRSLKPSNLDAKSLAKTVGDASQRFAKTSKSVSRDIERAGDRAERIGKILS